MDFSKYNICKITGVTYKGQPYSFSFTCCGKYPESRILRLIELSNICTILGMVGNKWELIDEKNRWSGGPYYGEYANLDDLILGTESTRFGDIINPDLEALIKMEAEKRASQLVEKYFQ